MKLICPNGHSETFTTGYTLRTAMFWQPRVDAEGHVVNAHENRNTSTTPYTCDVCHAKFFLKAQGGQYWLENAEGLRYEP